jgi:hypothetical protein
MDAITIEILEDGTLKITTDAVSGANHLNAEKLMASTVAAMGGEVKRERRKEGMRHTHTHTHGGHTHSH